MKSGYNIIKPKSTCSGKCNGSCGNCNGETADQGTDNKLVCQSACADVTIPAGATRIEIQNTGFKNLQYKIGNNAVKDWLIDCPPIVMEGNNLPETQLIMNKQADEKEGARTYSIQVCYPAGPAGAENIKSIESQLQLT